MTKVSAVLKHFRMEYRLPRNVEKVTSVNTLFLGKYPRPGGGGWGGGVSQAKLNNRRHRTA